MSDELRVDSGALIFATLADVYISSGMIDEAISILKDGLARNPNYHLAQIILGRAYYLKGDIQEAIKTIETVYSEVKDSESANLYLGHCYRDLGEKERARTYYEATLKIEPENMDALKEIEKLIPDFTPPPKVGPVKAAEPEPTEPEAIAIPLSVEEKPDQVIPDEEERTPAKVDEVAIEPVIVEEDRAQVSEEYAAAGEEETEVELAPIESVIEDLPQRELEVEAVPLEALDKPVKRLLDLDTVRGVFISTKDGLLIKNYGEAEQDVESVCAAVAAICMDVDESFRLLKRGGLTRCIIEKPDETLCVMVVGESLLTVITQVEAKPGLVFIYARKIIEEIEEILG
jgi:predicted regulator of Ras-like GTPase activity (Roadblock/LC7/MglB family)